MTQNFKLLLALFVTILTGCAPAHPPVPAGTIPVSTAPSISDEQYGHEVVVALSAQYPIDYQNPRLDKVQEIVDRLTKAAKAEQHPWHLYLFRDDSTKNAAATRGNHLFLWTGMLNATKSDGELATVLAHEIAHVLAGHTAEDPNQEFKRIMIQVAGIAAGVAVSAATGSATLGMNVGGLAQDATTMAGEGLLMNPFSREDEHQADQIGLELMAEAGYDPQEGIRFWERAQSDPDFSASIPFLSTHPPAPERLERLKQILPLAEARYRKEKLPTLQNKVDPPITTAQRAPAPTPPAQQGDTFDLNTQPTRPQDLQGGPLPWADEWKVIADRALLYADPSTRGAPIGEFKNGATVRSVGRRNGWLRIQRPDHGFLREIDLVPVFRPDTPQSR